MMGTLNRAIGILYVRLTLECSACRGYGTPDRTLFDTVDEMLAAPMPPTCLVCGGMGRVWRRYRRRCNENRSSIRR